MKPRMPSRFDSLAIQIVHAVAVSIRSQLNPEITQVANGAEKNSPQACSPALVKWIPKQTMGNINPTADNAAYTYRNMRSSPVNISSRFTINFFATSEYLRTMITENLRQLLIPVIFCIGIVAYVDPVGAQFEPLPYKVGDKIEIRYFDNWFEAKVSEILPRGVALKAEFTDETGEKTTSVFTSRDIRERRALQDPNPAIKTFPNSEAKNNSSNQGDRSDPFEGNGKEGSKSAKDDQESDKPIIDESVWTDTSPAGKSMRSDVGDMTEQGMVRVPPWIVTLFRWGPFSVLFLGGFILFTVGLMNSNKYY